MKPLPLLFTITVTGLAAGGIYWGAQSPLVVPEPVPQAQTSAIAPISAQTFRTPTCGCCGLWIDHAQNHHFVIEDHQQPDLTALKAEYRITPELASCHTTVAQGYVFEGHIPPADIVNFLANPPADVVGLTVPGMPIGSPGMEMGDRQQPYQVLALHKDGSTSVFNEYP